MTEPSVPLALGVSATTAGTRRGEVHVVPECRKEHCLHPEDGPDCVPVDRIQLCHCDPPPRGPAVCWNRRFHFSVRLFPEHTATDAARRGRHNKSPNEPQLHLRQILTFTITLILACPQRQKDVTFVLTRKEYFPISRETGNCPDYDWHSVWARHCIDACWLQTDVTGKLDVVILSQKRRGAKDWESVPSDSGYRFDGMTWDRNTPPLFRTGAENRDQFDGTYKDDDGEHIHYSLADHHGDDFKKYQQCTYTYHEDINHCPPPVGTQTADIARGPGGGPTTVPWIPHAIPVLGGIVHPSTHWSLGLLSQVQRQPPMMMRSDAWPPWRLNDEDTTNLR